MSLQLWGEEETVSGLKGDLVRGLFWPIPPANQLAPKPPPANRPPPPHPLPNDPRHQYNPESKEINAKEKKKISFPFITIMEQHDKDRRTSRRKKIHLQSQRRTPAYPQLNTPL